MVESTIANCCSRLDPSELCLNRGPNAAFASVFLVTLTETLSMGLAIAIATGRDVQMEPWLVGLYETVALGWSAFCGLFTEEEWKGYEYAFDLELWYSFGPGNPASAAQGIGYVQELVARLTQTPLTEFNTNLNGTLDGSNVTFPLTQPIYVDATHDTVISTILVALNFTTMAANGPLPVDHIPQHQTYTGQHITPFAANLVGQVMSCPASGKSSKEKESYIRFLHNDGVVPLTGITHCTENKDGLCAVDNFVKGMKQRIAEVDYVYDCFANYTAPWPDPIIDGRMHK
ncbi:hypothetical protein NUW54_g1213 [Trametes sanguinea]|uniref:Uncharacterized protein n=1 Tax=Trametes sanguinea TaxID=158606 RepID=A0ACC1Q9E7_9APHY|nr:hypothetical protein NUW54_g1213 [Trametes sanguinea]